MGKVIDMTNKKYGHLLVIKRGDDYITPKKHKEIQWWCRCDCGNPDLILVRGYCLRRGTTTSCGCEQKKLVSERFKKYNLYDLSGEYGIGYTSKGEEFYFDLEDYDKIKNYSWYIHHGYVCTSIWDNNNYNMIMMHNIVMNNDKDKIIDHIKHKTNDNRKSQLRYSDDSKNQMNKRIQRNNTSGVPGVTYIKRDGVWVARISINGKRIHLGSSKDFNEAVKLRKEAEEKYFGKFSYDNSMKYMEIEGA